MEEADLEATPTRKMLLGLLAELVGSIEKSASSLRTFLITGEDQIRNTFRQSWSIVATDVQKIKGMEEFLSPTQQSLFKKIENNMALLPGLFSKIIEIRSGEEWNRAEYLLSEKVQPYAEQLLSNLEEIASTARKYEVQDLTSIQAGVVQIQNIVVGILSAALLIGLIAAGLLNRNLRAVLSRTTNSLTKTADQVYDSSEQLSFASDHLSEEANKQAERLNKTVYSLRDIADFINQNGDNTRKASELASEANNNAQAGSHAINEMVEAMTDISESSTKIVGILKVIDEIASQTNLLALNANVEAARAGEFGRGFAVVAEEVRNLAQRSAQAAKDTATLIQESVKKSKHGSDLAEHCGEALQKILSSSGGVADLLTSIAAASEQQTSSVKELNLVVEELDTLTKETVVMATESAQSSTDLAQQTTMLRRTVGDLTILVAGKELYTFQIDPPKS